jgi:hypothetical protein
MSSYFYYDDEHHLYRVQTKNYQWLAPVKKFLNLKKVTVKTDGFYIGPRPEMITSWSSNVVSILHESGIREIDSIER